MAMPTALLPPLPGPGRLGQSAISEGAGLGDAGYGRWGNARSSSRTLQSVLLWRNAEDAGGWGLRPRQRTTQIANRCPSDPAADQPILR